LTFRRGFAQHEFVRRAHHSCGFLLLGILIISIASVSTRAGTIHLSAAGPSPTLLNIVIPGNWAAVRTNVAGGSSISFTNPATAGACSFRVVQLP